jgi:hypothetical protein
VSILFATLMGTHLLSEGRSGRRLAAAVTMVVGVVALAVDCSPAERADGDTL